ncbi:integrin [Exilibacterium tricleocarpae]|uniref:Integrin n=1 Tax=Exilibacterium tricleocarpae TaxID=2591008 RepID=A0A545TFF5_9GAMM|nr:integrin [Exilibacterium tricleocarpae]TQV75953.1 integrin [Exilibacterium tricleocarpae]
MKNLDIVFRFLSSLLLPILLSACGGGGGGDGAGDGGSPPNTTASFTVTASAGANGSIGPASQTVSAGDNTSFAITPDNNFTIDSISGCNGSVSGNTYTTSAINADCSVTATFKPGPSVPTLSFVQAKTLRVSWADTGGATHYRLLANPDGTSGFAQVGDDIAPGVGEVDLPVSLFESVNAQYMLQSCVNVTCSDSSAVSVSGTLVDGIGYFKASNTDGADEFGVSVSLNSTGDILAVGALGEDSAATGVDGDASDDSASSAGAVYVFARSGNTWRQQAYLKASNTESGDQFGHSVSLNSSGDTLAVGAVTKGNASNQPDNTFAGAVYVFNRSGDTWSQQAYIEADDPGINHLFGESISLNSTGDTLAVGSSGENRSNGAVYVYFRNGDTWSTQRHFKLPSPLGAHLLGISVSLDSTGDTLAAGAGEGAVYIFTRSDNRWNNTTYRVLSGGIGFGASVSLNSAGDTLAVGAPEEDSAATGIDGDDSDSSAESAGAVFVYTRSDGNIWNRQTYIKASNTGPGDKFGTSVSLNDAGDKLVVSAVEEASIATGIDDSQDDDSTEDAGAVYMFTRSGNTWSQQSYIKASNTGSGDKFGTSLSFDSAGDTLAVGAGGEASAAEGIGGDQSDDSRDGAGAVYLY